MNQSTMTSSQYPDAIGRVDIVFSQSTTTLRWIESTTECRHLESIFLLIDDARDAHIKQLLAVHPHLKEKNRVVRYANVKLDQHFSDLYQTSRTRPRYGQLFRVETRFTAIGNTSLKLQHRFLTVPNSQVNRDFNNRDEDDQYAVLEENDEPERVFASAEGSLVFIKWQKDDNGRRFFKSTPGIFQNRALIAPPVTQFLVESAPEMRPLGSPRPLNAFRVQIHLRKSDEDQLGHVTNSRYVSLIHDVLTFGLRTGYYANGVGSSKTVIHLPTIPSDNALATTDIDAAVPAGSAYYKRSTVFELYVGFERELKVKPGVYVWSWVEPKRIQDEFDVIRFEICSTNDQGKEEVVSLCRAIIREDPRQVAAL